MDVFCGGMYRACSTWQYEVSAHLLERHRDGRRLGYVTGEAYPATFEGEAGDERGWRVLKSHEGDRSFARALSGGRALALYSYRDVRDVAFSLMHKRRLDFKTLVRRGMLHQVLENHKFWSRQPGLLVQRYEDLIADPAAGVVQIARHLGLALAPGEAARVAGEYSLETNRARAARLLEQLVRLGVDLDDPGNAQLWDRETLLHWNHCRQGRPGDWRDRATPEQRAVLSRVCNRWLRDHGYEVEPGPKPFAARRAVLVLRGRLACAARCAALNHPVVARRVKSLLGLPRDGAPGGPAPADRPRSGTGYGSPSPAAPTVAAPGLPGA